MSYDIKIMIQTGDDSYYPLLEFNITYNLRPIFIKCMNNENGIFSLHGLKCEEAIELLEIASIDLTDPEKYDSYEDLNPPNGWGDCNGAFSFILKLLAGCVKHNYGYIEVK
jgi:hypothetical protein